MKWKARNSESERGGGGKRRRSKELTGMRKEERVGAGAGAVLGGSTCRLTFCRSK